jgi:hypothetical protein
MRVDDEDGRYRREGCEVVETTYAAFTYTTQSVTAPAWPVRRARRGCTRLPGGTLLNRAGRLLAVEPERRRDAVFESAGG